LVNTLWVGGFVLHPFVSSSVCSEVDTLNDVSVESLVSCLLVFDKTPSKLKFLNLITHQKEYKKYDNHDTALQVINMKNNTLNVSAQYH